MSDYRRWNEAPFFAWPGIRIVRAADGEAFVELDVADHHRNGCEDGPVNGGIAAYLVDGLFGVCAHSARDEGVTGQVTMSITVNYLRPLLAARVVRAEARVVRAGRTAAYLAGELYGDGPEPCVSATGIYRYFRNER